jgi:glucan 1,3-beta-glucosidase
MYGIMGIANAQRSLDYIRAIAEFISQPEYVNLVQIFSPVNEALLGDIGIDSLSRFYYEMHNMIRSITGVGEGAWLAIHDGFKGTDPWKDFLPGADRFIMDTHPYLSFGGAGVMKDPFSNGSTGHAAGNTYPLKACQGWGPGMVQSQQQFGVTIAGEFSNGWNDCGLFLHGVPPPGQPDQQSFPGDCSTWTAGYVDWGQDVKDGLQNFALASMDALENWFFWTWKIQPAQNGTIMTPLWSYSLGLEGGWMPKDPRTSNGTCSSYGYDILRFNNQYQPYQVGGGDGTVVASAQAAFGQWPPPTISAFPPTMDFALAPTYTASAPIETLTVTYPATLTSLATSAKTATATGWWNTNDNRPRYTSVADCVYPDPWTIGPTTVVCTGSATATRGTGTETISAIVPPPTPAKVVAQP